MLTEKSAFRKDTFHPFEALPQFQHRHFAAIAGIIATIPDAGVRADVAAHFADRLTVSNPRFDHARFLRAANGEGA